jgi:NitT/TauT family transport system substrate-binding protein
LLGLVATVVFGSVLAACGSGPNAGSSQAEAGVTIAKAVDTIGFTTVDVAQAKGYFAKQGVSVKEELLGGSSTAFAALQSGSVQFVTASSTALLAAKAKGLPLEAVTSLDYGVSLQMIASDSWITTHNLSAQQPLNTVMKGMTGATLGVISTTDLAYSRYLSQAAGVDPDKFKIITLKTQAAALAALQHGQIDAFLLSPPNSFLAQAQGGAQIIATLHSVPELSRMTYDVLVVDSDYAKSNPDVVKSVATAMAMADQVMAKDPSSVLDVEKAHYPAMSDEVLLASLKYVTFAPDGKMTQDGWQAAKDISAQTGVASVSSVDVSAGGGTWTNDYIKTGDLSSGGGEG